MAVSLFERLAMERDPQFLAIQYRAWAWRGEKKVAGGLPLRDVASGFFKNAFWKINLEPKNDLPNLYFWVPF